MQLGFVSAILPELRLAEVLEFAAGEGFDCIEPMCWPIGKAERKYAGVTHVDVLNLTPAEVDRIRQLCDRHKVSLSGLGYYPNVLSGDPDESRRCLAHLRQVIAAAPKLGLDRVNTFVGNDHRQGVEPNFARFLTVWPHLVKLAEDHGVRLGIENCPMLFTGDEWPAGKNLAYSPALWRRLFGAIPSAHLGLNYDPSHMVWQMMDYVQPLAEFRERIFHVHAKDMKIDRRRLNDEGILALGWTIPKIPGLGEIDWSKFISALTDIGYQGPVCIEVEDDAFRRDLAARQRSLRIARNVLRPLIDHA